MAWADEIARTNAEIVYFLRIEGYPYWFFTRTPDASWTPPTGVTFRDGLEVPSSLTQSIKLFEGSSSVGHMVFRLKDIAQTPGATISTSNPYFLTQAFATGRPFGQLGTLYAAYLTADLDANDTTVAVTTATNMPGSDFDLYVGIETMRVTAGFGTTSLTVTRARYPCVDGAGLGMRHSYADDTEGGTRAPLALVANAPFAWVNRRVALHATWYDRASGTFGAQGESQVIWPGRLARLDFDQPTDEWKLDCKPLIDDLSRSIFSDGASSILLGVQLNGVQSRSVRVRVERSNGDGTSDDVAVGSATLPERWYAGAGDFIAELNEQLATDATMTALPYNTSVRFLQPAVQMAFTASVSGDDVVKCFVTIDAPIAVVLGFTDSYAPVTIDVSLRSSFDDIRTTPTVYSSVGSPAMNVFHPAEATQIRVWSTTGFVSNQDSGNVVRGAVLLDGALALRYGSIVDATTLGAVNSGVPTAGGRYLRRGPAFVGRRGDLGTYAQIPAVQAYVTPRTVGWNTEFSIFRELLRLLTSTGTLAENGSYDVLPAGYGLGIPAAYIDTASFTAMDATFGEEMTEREWLVTQPTPLIDMINAEAKTLGFYVVMNGSGQLALRLAVADLAASSAVALNESNRGRALSASRIERSSFAVSPASILNQVTFRFNYDIAGQTYTEYSTNWRVSQQQYETTRGITIENRGLLASETTDLPVLQGNLTARIGIYADPWPTIGRSINRQLFTRLVPGDRVTLTDSGLPDVFTGQRGVTGRTALVVSVDFDLHTGIGKVTLIFDGIVPDSMRAPLCPSARITAFDVGTSVATLASNEFSAAPSTDYGPFSVGDVVLIVEGSATDPTAPTNTQRTITNISGLGAITLDGNIGGLNPATSVVYMTFARRASATTDQATRGTWLAAIGTNLIASTYPARKYL